MQAPGRQPTGMLNRSSQSWFPTQALALLAQALALLAFFVYATHATQALALRAFEWKPGLSQNKT